MFPVWYPKEAYDPQFQMASVAASCTGFAAESQLRILSSLSRIVTDGV